MRSPAPLATASVGWFTLSDILERYRTIGDIRPVDLLAGGPSAFKGMETPKQLIDTRANALVGTRTAPSPKAFVMKAPIRTLGTVPAPEDSVRWARIGFGCFRSPGAVLKPTAGGIRRMPPAGSPKGEGRHGRASRRSTGGVASSQVDPPQGGTGARAQRHGRWRDRSPFRLPECMDGAAPPVSVPPPAALREVRLNGFPRAVAEVHRHRVGGGIRVAEAAPTGVLDARFVVEPAYSRTGNGAP